MARSLTAGMTAALVAASQAWTFLIELQFDSATLRFATAANDLDWSGDTYVAGAEVTGLGEIKESEAVTPSEMTITLNGQDPALIAIVHGEDYQQRPGIVRLAALDSTGAIVADPVEWFTGLMDVIEDSDDGRDARFTLTLLNELAVLDGAADRRYTPEDQKLDYPPADESPEAADRMFDGVTALQSVDVILD